MFIYVLKGLDKTHYLVDVAANWKIIDAVLTEDTIRINDESASKSDTTIFTILN